MESASEEFGKLYKHTNNDQNSGHLLLHEFHVVQGQGEIENPHSQDVEENNPVYVYVESEQIQTLNEHGRIPLELNSESAFIFRVINSSVDGSLAQPLLHTGEKQLRNFDETSTQKQTNSVSDLEIHRAKNLKRKVYVCRLCKMSFKLRREYQLIFHTDTEEKPYRCETCGKSFNSKTNFYRHAKTHTTEKSKQCETCGLCFRRLDHLIRHRKNHHPGQNPYPSKPCGNGFESKTIPEITADIHTGENRNTYENYAADVKKSGTVVKKSYKCETCGKYFRSNSTLISHRRIHTGEKPFQCEICGNAYTKLCHLKDHHARHTGEKSYTCDVCKKQFYTIVQLKKHKRSHENRDSDQYKCPLCGKHLSSARHLKDHLNIRRKVHKCDACCGSYDSIQGLIHHKRSYHKSTVHPNTVSSGSESQTDYPHL